MEELWDIRRVSQYLGIKRSTLYAMIERKEIPHYRIGRLARFRQAEIDAWLLTKKAGPSRKRPGGCPGNGGSPPSPAAQIVRAAIDEVKPRTAIIVLGNQTVSRASERRDDMGLYRRGPTWWISFTYNGRQVRQSTETDDKKWRRRFIAR